MLDRKEALKHPWIKEVFHITDHIVEEDKDVAEVTLLPRYASDMPRGLLVEVSRDGASWTKVAAAHAYWGPCSWARGRPLPDYDGWVVSRFAPVRARFVRLTQLGTERFYAWSIAEIIVRAPGPLRRRRALPLRAVHDVKPIEQLVVVASAARAERRE